MPGGPPLALPKLWAVAVLVGMTGVQSIEFGWNVRVGDNMLWNQGKKTVSHEPTQDHHTFANWIAPFPLPTAGKYVFTISTVVEEKERSFSKVLDVRAAKQAQLPGVQ